MYEAEGLRGAFSVDDVSKVFTARSRCHATKVYLFGRFAYAITSSGLASIEQISSSFKFVHDTCNKAEAKP